MFPEDKRGCDEFLRQRLNERLFERIQKVEMKRMKAEKDEEKKKSKMNKEDKKKFEQEQKQKQLNDLGRRGKGKVRYLIKNQILLDYDVDAISYYRLHI